MINLPKIQDADLEAKKVLLRADLDVPIADGKILDDLRLQASLETINYCLSKASRVIVCGHLGRPNGRNQDMSLQIIADWYANNFQFSIFNFQSEEFDGWQVGEKLFLLENLRFNPGEEANDETFAKELAELGDVYVNDSFATCHREHASIVGVPKFLPHFAGLRLQKEVEELSKVLEKPQRPLTVIVGGAKIETKLPLVGRMHHFADYVLVGGEIAEHTKELIKVAHEKIIGQKAKLIVADLTSDQKDITKETVQLFSQVISDSKTVVWNGPMGKIISNLENNSGATTRKIAEAIIASGAYSIVGGGDTVGFLNKQGLLLKFSFVSTGGGAMLEFLSGEKLPGLAALSDKG